MSIVYGALVCMAQWDLKRLLAYSSVAHKGYVTLGLCAAAAGYGGAGQYGSPQRGSVGGAVIFVLDVAQFLKA